MRRRLAEQAEVARRADEAEAEMVLPDAVDHDARGQRIVLVGDRVRQFQPAAALREEAARCRPPESSEWRGASSPGVSDCRAAAPAHWRSSALLSARG